MVGAADVVQMLLPWTTMLQVLLLVQLVLVRPALAAGDGQSLYRSSRQSGGSYCTRQLRYREADASLPSELCCRKKKVQWKADGERDASIDVQVEYV